jgi:biotin operon repressor
VSSKSKVEIAREHLSKAQEEAAGDDLRDAIQWSFASLEAAIDALAEKHGIEIEAKHWRRAEAATELHEKDLLPQDLSDLHRLLNEERKGMFYEGEDPELGDLSMEDVLSEIETAVEIAEAEAK